MLREGEKYNFQKGGGGNWNIDPCKTIFKEDVILKFPVGCCNYLGTCDLCLKILAHPRILIDSPVYSTPGSQLRIRITPRIFEKNFNSFWSCLLGPGEVTLFHWMFFILYVILAGILVCGQLHRYPGTCICSSSHISYSKCVYKYLYLQIYIHVHF